MVAVWDSVVVVLVDIAGAESYLSAVYDLTNSPLLPNSLKRTNRFVDGLEILEEML